MLYDYCLTRTGIFGREAVVSFRPSKLNPLKRATLLAPLLFGSPQIFS